MDQYRFDAPDAGARRFLLFDFETAKLAQSNRQGRKIMQSYFKKKGVAVAFSA